MQNKSKFLKVVSILIIIGAIFPLLQGLLLLGAAGAASILDGADVSPMSWIVVILIIAQTVLDLITGIVGSRTASGNGDLALCRKLGWAVVIVAIVFMVFRLNLNHEGYTLVGALLNLFFPILYCVGVKSMSKKAN